MVWLSLKQCLTNKNKPSSLPVLDGNEFNPQVKKTFLVIKRKWNIKSTKIMKNCAKWTE